MSNERRRLAALIEYVQQSARGRAKLVSHVSDHGRFLLMERHLAGLDGVKLNDAGPDGEDEVWLSVPRPPNPESVSSAAISGLRGLASMSVKPTAL